MNYADNDAPLSRTRLWDTENRSIYISGTIAHEYAGNHLRVKTFDPENKNIVTDGYGSYATYVGKSYFYFSNVLEEIDVPGESYVDETSGIAYFYPYEGIENASIEIATYNQNMIQMTDVDYITFKNINFGYSKEKILETSNTDYLTIDHCEFAHTSSNAMTVNGTNITIKNSHIYDLAGKRGTGGTAIFWDRLSSSALNFFENEVWKKKYGDQFGAYWTLFTQEQKTALESMYIAGTKAADNQALMDAAYAHYDMLTNTNIMKNNLVIDTLIPVEYKDNANYHEEGSGTGKYTKQEAQGFFKNYGADFTLTDEGLATIKQTIPAFEVIDFDAIGKSYAGVTISDVVCGQNNITMDIVNNANAAKIGILVVVTSDDDAPAEIKLKVISVFGKSVQPKTVELSKPYNEAKVFVLKDILSMQIFSNIVEQKK